MFATFLFVLILSASVTSAQTIASCAAKDNGGKPLTSTAKPSASADGLITCVYGGAGNCVYFANASGLSSGSSDCPTVETKGSDSSPPPPPPKTTTSEKPKTTSTSSKESTSTSQETSSSKTSVKTTSTKEATSTTSSKMMTSTSSSSTSAMASSTSSASRRRKYRKTSSMASATSTIAMPSSSVYHFTSTSVMRTKSKTFGSEKNFVPSTTSMPSKTSSASKTKTTSKATATSSSKGHKKSKTSSKASKTTTSKKPKKTKPVSNAAIKVKGNPSLVPRPTGTARPIKPLGLVISKFDDKIVNFTSGISQAITGGAASDRAMVGLFPQALAIGSALLAIVITLAV